MTSSHLFNAESISETTLSSHCSRIRPPIVFAFLVEYWKADQRALLAG